MNPEDIVTLVVGMFTVGWATWVSHTLWTINQHVTGLVERMNSHERRIDDLEDLLPRHIPQS